LGLVKPDAAIYKKVSESINKPLSEIIFFDDNEFNIESALNLGMDAHLIYPDNSIEQINQTLSAYVYE
jgi:HAD superfamily hydrolase (TIGR01509 family)